MNGPLALTVTATTVVALFTVATNSIPGGPGITGLGTNHIYLPPSLKPAPNAPGVYRCDPYRILVKVPSPVDSRMNSHGTPESPDKSVKDPGLQLVPHS